MEGQASGSEELRDGGADTISRVRFCCLIIVCHLLIMPSMWMRQREKDADPGQQGPEITEKSIQTHSIVLALKEENHRNLLNRYIDDSMSMQACCLLGRIALIIRFRVMPRTYGVATSVLTRYKNVSMSRSRQRGGRSNNYPILSDWPTVPLPAAWGNEVHISYVKTNTTDRDSSNCGPFAPMAPITGRPKYL